MNEKEKLDNLIKNLKVCPKCKRVISGNEKYCPNCGNNLSENNTTQLENNSIKNNTINNIQIKEEPTPNYKLSGAIMGTFILTFLVALFLKEVVDYGGRSSIITYMLSGGISVGWIGGIIGYIIGYKMDINILQEYQLEQQKIKKKQYEEEHNPENEKKKRDKELQDSIDSITPFKTLEEAIGYHIIGIAYEVNSNDIFQEVNVILRNDTTNKQKNLSYTYKGKKVMVDVPYGATSEGILRIKRQQIYNLIEDKEYEKASELFREVFKIDPFTGKDFIIDKSIN